MTPVVLVRLACMAILFCYNIYNLVSHRTSNSFRKLESRLILPGHSTVQGILFERARGSLEYEATELLIELQSPDLAQEAADTVKRYCNGESMVYTGCKSWLPYLRHWSDWTRRLLGTHCGRQPRHPL